MKSMKKTLLMGISFILVAAIAIGGTLAYITVENQKKSNVFTVGDIDIWLDEETGVIGEGGEVTETADGASYDGVMPGDYLKKEVTVTNTGSKPAYVAVTVTLNNAQAINAAIDAVYGDSDEGGTAQAMYNFIFDGWGINQAPRPGKNGRDARGVIDGTYGLPEHVLNVDFTKTIPDNYWLYSAGNWFYGSAEKPGTYDAGYYTNGEGYYAKDMEPDQIRYTYYLLLEADESSTLFKGLNVPAEFNEDQMAMFDGLVIDIDAAAIQADNIPGEGEEKAKNAFTALRGEYLGWTRVTVDESDDLLNVLATAAEEGEHLYIILNGDVEWPTEGHHGVNDVTKAASVVIDGQGEYTLTATGSGVTPLGDDNAPMTLKNIKIVDKSVSYAEITYLEIGGSSLTCSNVTFADEIMIGTNATFTNCSFESNEESVYAVWVDNGSATFNNCTFTGYRGLKAHEYYGTEISSVVVTDCTFSNITKKPGIALGTLNADTTVSITGSSFINCQPGDQNLYIYETDTDVSTIKFTNENNTVLNQTSVSNAEELTAALDNGENVVLNNPITIEAATTAPYGNKLGLIQNGGTIDGNGNTLTIECYGDDYGIMTSGGTIKNLTIDEGCRAVMIMSPTEDIILDNVKIGGDGVLYPINTGEYATVKGVDLFVSNSVLAGWTSFAGIESASFTNVEFRQGTYYNNIYGRVLKPYVNTTLTDCSFIEHMNLDLSALGEGQKVTIVNCTVNGQAVTANVFTVVASDEQYDTELFTIDLPSWADSIDDCIIFK